MTTENTAPTFPTNASMGNLIDFLVENRDLDQATIDHVKREIAKIAEKDAFRASLETDNVIKDACKRGKKAGTALIVGGMTDRPDPKESPSAYYAWLRS